MRPEPFSLFTSFLSNLQIFNCFELFFSEKVSESIEEGGPEDGGPGEGGVGREEGCSGEREGREGPEFGPISIFGQFRDWPDLWPKTLKHQFWQNWPKIVWPNLVRTNLVLAKLGKAKLGHSRTGL